MKKLFVLFLAVVSVSALSACNTVQGIGKDVKKVGEVVESAGKK
ncbi:entericidin A/B family lipoprotein [Undibacterium cyanobacteriorum]|uniref:Entericidin A/B family lipoprotein n=1 Tax=Undibacterium cyanobacteriorum TaxID=3073561 RepID=A0ABY9RD41_9BURK|nr:entericidin A/B family lipoprotein [Undibacterium sp. 20NA77.5]WMW79127.1 entericidin A/B family lipoprotein [Undibacterium sp. 20NA77.5]